jgi:hypothetical protein
VSEADGGMYDAINRAWARSQGEFLAWLNSDEQYLPGTLLRVQQYFDTHPQVDVLFGNYIVTDAAGQPVALRREIPFRALYVANGHLYAQSCTLFFRRRLLEQGNLKLDARYRYAADKELMLRLAGAGAVIRHLPHYLALFGIDGSNLSTHARAHEESEQIRRQYGAFDSALLRRLVMGGRRVERLLSGGYRGHPIRYRYACDETPHYVEFERARLGGRYSLADTQGKAAQVRSVESG